jgi:SAM-dependent methyltransferase
MAEILAGAHDARSNVARPTVADLSYYLFEPLTLNHSVQVIKQLLRNRGIRALARRILGRKQVSRLQFAGSREYWEERYAAGRNSGPGSYNELAEFKALVLNDFVRLHEILDVIEFGCGDGNQLRLARYPSYIGFDVSPTALELCRAIFADDQTKRFALMQDYARETADMALSLDVIFHLVEDEVYEHYMARLFQAARRFVAIYSSNHECADLNVAPHVRHRRFTDWISTNQSGWTMLDRVQNPYPWSPKEKTGSFADFYFFQRKPAAPVAC